MRLPAHYGHILSECAAACPAFRALVHQPPPPSGPSFTSLPSHQPGSPTSIPKTQPQPAPPCLGFEGPLSLKVSQDPKGTGWGWRTRVPRESQPCPHSPEPAPLLGQGPTAGIWVELGPSCFWRCLRLDSGCLTGSPAMVHEASGNRAVLFWDGDGAPGRLAAAEISAPLVCVLFASPLMIRQSSVRMPSSEPLMAHLRVLIAVVVLLKWGLA